ncbi:MAG: oxidoreductase [Chitinophagaceae bacterium]|nr:oxidoreductase [Chitinophagaceae bacterium]
MLNKTALLLGASGLTGRNVLQLLLNDSLYTQVTIYVRRPVKLSHPKLIQQVINYETLDTALEADDVFCCLGTTIKKAGSQEAFRQVDLVYPLRVAALQLAAGSTQFNLISAVGASEKSGIFYSRIKGEVEQALQRMGFPQLNIFRPSIIIGERDERRTGEKIALGMTRVIAPLLIGSLRKYRPVTALAIARAMLHYAHAAEQGIHIITSDQIQLFEQVSR